MEDGSVFESDGTSVSVISGGKEPSEFGVTDIPVKLFEEISRFLGIGDPRKITTRGGEYNLIELNPDHRTTGFQGAIGLQQGTRSEFVLWDTVPKGEPNNVFEPKYILRIVGGKFHAGEWAYGRGHKVQEKTVLELRPFGELSVQNPAMKLVALVIYKAHLLTQDKSFKTGIFWEGDLLRPD